MSIITEEVVIRGIVHERAPTWAVGLTGHYNAWICTIDLCNPANGWHQLFPAEAFIFEPTATNDTSTMRRRTSHESGNLC